MKKAITEQLQYPSPDFYLPFYGKHCIIVLYVPQHTYGAVVHQYATMKNDLRGKGAGV